MRERLTTEEIFQRYPEEWVLLADPETDESLRVFGGSVIHHSRDRDEVYAKAVEIRPRRIAFLYTGDSGTEEYLPMLGVYAVLPEYV